MKAYNYLYPMLLALMVGIALASCQNREKEELQEEPATKPRMITITAGLEGSSSNRTLYEQVDGTGANAGKFKLLTKFQAGDRIYPLVWSVRNPSEERANYEKVVERCNNGKYITLHESNIIGDHDDKVQFSFEIPEYIEYGEAIAIRLIYLPKPESNNVLPDKTFKKFSPSFDAYNGEIKYGSPTLLVNNSLLFFPKHMKNQGYIKYVVPMATDITVVTNVTEAISPELNNVTFKFLCSLLVFDITNNTDDAIKVSELRAKIKTDVANGNSNYGSEASFLGFDFMKNNIEFYGSFGKGEYENQRDPKESNIVFHFSTYGNPHIINKDKHLFFMMPLYSKGNIKQISLQKLNILTDTGDYYTFYGPLELYSGREIKIGQAKRLRLTINSLEPSDISKTATTTPPKAPETNEWIGAQLR